MADEQNKVPDQYAYSRQARQAAKKLPESNKTTLTPQYLLKHENHFDPNVKTPEQMIQQGATHGGLKPESTT